MSTPRLLIATVSILTVGMVLMSVGFLRLRDELSQTGGFGAGQASQSAGEVRSGSQLASYTPRTDPELTAVLAGQEKATGTALAVTVINHTTGEAYQYNAGTSFAMASTVKVGVLAALLLKAQRAGRGLTERELSLAEAMIKKSDNDATTALWREIGSSAGFTAAAKQFGLTATVTDPTGAWGLTRTTTGDQAQLLTAISDPDGPLSPTNGGYILQLLSEVYASQAWGVSAAARPGELVALKNGWLAEPEGSANWIINSVGRITGTNAEITIAVLSRGHPTMAAGISLVEKVATTSREHLMS